MLAIRASPLVLRRVPSPVSLSRATSRALASPSTPNHSTNTNTSKKPEKQSASASSSSADPSTVAAHQQQHKSIEVADAELREKLEAMSGEGGAAGLELEGGKPVAMKRGVRENMFRLI